VLTAVQWLLMRRDALGSACLWSVGQSVGPSVRPSVRPGDRRAVARAGGVPQVSLPRDGSRWLAGWTSAAPCVRTQLGHPGGTREGIKGSLWLRGGEGGCSPVFFPGGRGSPGAGEMGSGPGSSRLFFPLGPRGYSRAAGGWQQLELVRDSVGKTGLRPWGATAAEIWLWECWPGCPRAAFPRCPARDPAGSCQGMGKNPSQPEPKANPPQDSQRSAATHLL